MKFYILLILLGLDVGSYSLFPSLLSQLYQLSVIANYQSFLCRDELLVHVMQSNWTAQRLSAVN